MNMLRVREFRQSGQDTLQVCMGCDAEGWYVVGAKLLQRSLDECTVLEMVSQSYKYEKDAVRFYETIVGGLLPVYQEVGDELGEEDFI